MATRSSSKNSTTKSKKKPVNTAKKVTKPAPAVTAAEAKVIDTKPEKSVKKDGFARRVLRKFNTELSPQALLAELGGTFILTSSVLFTSGDAFFTGLTVIVLAAGIFAISGAHLNPAVTFGLWAGRGISIYRALFYWVAQFLGAIAALVVSHLFSGTPYDVSLASFWAFDGKVFFAEAFGTAVFLFGLVAAVNRGQTDIAKAAGIGLSLFLGLIIATGLLSQAVQGLSQSGQDASSSRLAKVNNVALNPAVALALTERDPSQSSLTGAPDTDAPTPPSRLTIEVIFGTFFGATVGVYAYRLLSRNDARE